MCRRIIARNVTSIVRCSAVDGDCILRLFIYLFIYFIGSSHCLLLPFLSYSPALVSWCFFLPMFCSILAHYIYVATYCHPKTTAFVSFFNLLFVFIGWHWEKIKTFISSIDVSAALFRLRSIYFCYIYVCIMGLYVELCKKRWLDKWQDKTY